MLYQNPAPGHAVIVAIAVLAALIFIGMLVAVYVLLQSTAGTKAGKGPQDERQPSSLIEMAPAPSPASRPADKPTSGPRVVGAIEAIALKAGLMIGLILIPVYAYTLQAGGLGLGDAFSVIAFAAFGIKELSLG
ncbi:MAG TPA: hypothetical protein VI524_08525 [Anaerolineales bacterium]|nr:hypothetical protein [Anaerolineales bacterium]